MRLCAHVVLGLTLTLAACGGEPSEDGLPEGVAETEAPLFNNPGFESGGGSLTNWTVTSYTNDGITFPPTSSGDLGLVAGGVANTFARTAVTSESVVFSGMTDATGVPKYPRIGTASAVVNESPNGDNHNVNSIRQSYTTTSADIDPNDGKIHVRWVLAPALQSAGHEAHMQPYFYVELRNTTRSTTLLRDYNYSSQPGVPWKTQGTGTNAVLYTDWTLFDYSGNEAQLQPGDTLEIEIYAAGCGFTAHWGEVYVDGFGSQIPTLWVSKTAPTAVNDGSTLTYNFTVTNGSGFLVPNVIVEDLIPAGTTFNAVNAPGATCTTPASGATGTVSCNFGYMTPGASTTFSLTVNVTALSVAPPTNRTGSVTGTGETGTTTQLRDTDKSFTTNEWAGWMLHIIAGTGAGQVRQIATNTGTRLNIVASNPFTTTPDDTSVYMVLPPTVTNGDYSVRGDTISEIQGPKVETAITRSVTYSDLAISITDGAPSAAPGAGITYTITVSNTSGAAVNNAVVTDTFPGTLSGIAWTCSNGGGAGNCDTAMGAGNINTTVDLPAGATVTFTVNATISAGATGQLSNTASVAAPAGVTDDDPTDNTDADVDTLGALFALTVTKDASNTGTGTVASTPVAISCGAACTSQAANFASGTSVTLSAVATTGSTFLGWTGACAAAGTAQTCTLTVSAAASVGALFTACGNGTLNVGEGCDDGARVSGDGCSSTCLVETGSSCNASSPGLTGGASCVSGICDTSETPDRCEAANTCGNGVVETGEGCDDGNTTALDGCNATCRVETGGNCGTVGPGLTGSASCASGICDTSEAPDRCEAANTCGNGIVEAGEGCDDGGTTAGDGCNATCRVETGGACGTAGPGLTGAASCASGICDVSETPDRCEAANTCGNAVVEAGEGCDDGNTTAGDGCNATCLVEAGGSCGTAGPGLTGAASCATGICDVSETPDRCETANACGNSVRETGEGCDDGNTTGGDGCSATCLVETGGACGTTGPGLTGSASCVSGICDVSETPDRCEAANTCGNAVVEAGEGCDDGNTTAGDGCNATCRIETGGGCGTVGPGLTGSSSCASGICDTSETPDRCEAANTCGNAVVEVGEGCDDGNTTAGDGCNATCRVETGGACGTAGPGLTGNASCASAICDTTETPDRCEAASTCGNGVIEAGEGCDDGGNVNADGCSAACLVEVGGNCNLLPPGAVGDASCASGSCNLVSLPPQCQSVSECGNGVLEVGEGCDDDNTTAGDGCSSTCLVEDGRACNTGVPGLVGDASCASGICDESEATDRCEAANSCGNGILEAGEGCDDGGTTAGDGCSATCLVETGGACNTLVAGATGAASCASGVCDESEAPDRCEAANTCGNGAVEAGEGCDDGNTTAGDGCNATCRVETGGACGTAGPGLTGAASCASGICDTSETPDRCEAANVCANGRLESGEGCDDGNTTDGDGCDAGCLIEIGGTCNATAPGLVGGVSCASGVCDTSGTPDVCVVGGTCGNNVLEVGEGCDDGGTTAGDGCSASCRVENGAACNQDAPGLIGGESCVSGACDTSGGLPGACADGGDADGDGVPDFADLDDDDDGILDTTEGTRDTDGDGVLDRLDLDSDDDGLVDAEEAGHRLGAADGEARIDCDGGVGTNGVCDALETSADSGELDYDGDGTADGTPRESDGDFVPDYRDLDSDADGLPDAVEAGHTRGDADGDATVDCPSGVGADGLCDDLQVDGDDGTVDYDGDGTASGGPRDTDGDGAADYRDLDSDDDGIYDAVEGAAAGCTGGEIDGLCDGGDADDDGLADALDGRPAAFGDDGDPVVPPDTDGDGVPDYRDLDADGDGRSDLVEGGSGCTDTTPSDGVCDGNDGDGDGLRDTVDDAPDRFGGAGGGLPPSGDDDGLPDYRDPDSDGNGTTDLEEDGHGDLDADGDGVIDDLTDTDGDGIADGIDSLPGTFGGLGVAPPADDDRDDDGITDDVDNCVDVANTEQIDQDEDGVGDACDRDADGDGFYDDVGVSGGGCAIAPAGPSRGAPSSGAPLGLLIAGAGLIAIRRRRR